MSRLVLNCCYDVPLAAFLIGYLRAAKCFCEECGLNFCSWLLPREVRIQIRLRQVILCRRGHELHPSSYWTPLSQATPTLRPLHTHRLAPRRLKKAALGKRIMNL